MKNIYIKPSINITKMMSETSVLASLSKGQVTPETPDSGLPGSDDLISGGNGDNEDAAKKHNAWANWDE